MIYFLAGILLLFSALLSSADAHNGASPNAAVFSTTVTSQVIVTHAVLPIITVTPSTPTVADNATPGTVLADVCVTLSDGSVPLPSMTVVISAETPPSPANIFALVPATVRAASCPAPGADYTLVIGSSGINMGPATDMVSIKATQ